MLVIDKYNKNEEIDYGVIRLVIKCPIAVSFTHLTNLVILKHYYAQGDLDLRSLVNLTSLILEMEDKWSYPSLNIYGLKELKILHAPNYYIDHVLHSDKLVQLLVKGYDHKIPSSVKSLSIEDRILRDLGINEIDNLYSYHVEDEIPPGIQYLHSFYPCGTDLQFMNQLPNLTYLAYKPTTDEDLIFDLSLQQVDLHRLHRLVIPCNLIQEAYDWVGWESIREPVFGDDVVDFDWDLYVYHNCRRSCYCLWD